MTNMRKWIDLMEASAAPESNSALTFYHGTSSTLSAKAILRKGLQPPDLGGRKGHLTPVNGMVYLTPSLGYAMIYAAGGNYIGNASYRIPFRGENKEKFDHILRNRQGELDRFGYVFAVSGAKLSMTQPDEDHVGELYHYILDQREPNPAYIDAQMLRAWEALKSNGVMMRRFSYHMGNWTTDTQKDKIQQGFISAYAAGGKRAIAKMDDELKTYLCSIGLHVAHQGAVVPDECWKFDKTKIGWMQKDGSNFFELATKIFPKGGQDA
jgi:hypothetical protein